MAAGKPGGGTSTGTNLLFSSSATEFSFNVPFIPVSQAPAAPPGPALLPAGTERGRQGGRAAGALGMCGVPPVLAPPGRGCGAGGALRAELGELSEPSRGSKGSCGPGGAGPCGLGLPVSDGDYTARDYIFCFLAALNFFYFPLLNASECGFSTDHRTSSSSTCQCSHSVCT